MIKGDSWGLEQVSLLNLPAFSFTLYSISLSQLWMKILNSFSASIDPWETQLITDFLLDIEPLTVTLLKHTASQFIIHLRVHSSNLYLAILVARMLHETIQKALQESKQMTSGLFPCSLMQSLHHILVRHNLPLLKIKGGDTTSLLG